MSTWKRSSPRSSRRRWGCRREDRRWETRQEMSRRRKLAASAVSVRGLERRSWDHRSLNGLKTSTPRCMKSFSFRVATARLCKRAVAAVITSYSISSCFPTIMRAAMRNEGPSIGRMIDVFCRSSTQASIAAAFAASWRRVRSIPSCSSPSVTADRQICSSRKL